MSVLAAIIEMIAQAGASSASTWLSYQPEMPEELQ